MGLFKILKSFIEKQPAPKESIEKESSEIILEKKETEPVVIERKQADVKNKLYQMAFDDYELCKIPSIVPNNLGQLKKELEALEKVGLHNSLMYSDIKKKIIDINQIELDNKIKANYVKAFDYYLTKYPMHLLIREEVIDKFLEEENELTSGHPYQYSGSRTMNKQILEHIELYPVDSSDAVAIKREDDQSLIIAKQKDFGAINIRNVSKIKEFDMLFLRKVVYNESVFFLIVTKL